ncbi:MAG: hypothetical protein R8G66_34650 [Cytophagales bacterium]|nr:hypothetical protein [Cytophagales bacterium]
MNSGRQAMEVYQTLSAQQKRFLTEKDLEDTKTLSEWIKFLEGPVQYDVLIDKTTQMLKKAILMLWVFAAFNLIVAIVTQSWYMGVLSVGMAILAIYQRFKRGSYFKRDLHNHLRLFFFPALQKLGESLDQSTAINTRFWLREKDQSEHIIVFSLNKDGNPVTVYVNPESYKIAVEKDGNKQITDGKNLHYSAFVEDFDSL